MMNIIQFREANCKNCYKCLRGCPVKAISVRNNQAQIVREDCMLCGNCLTVCPQNAKTVVNNVDTVREYIARREKVYVSLAPSFVSAFDGAEDGWLFAALRRLGFTMAEETAVGAVQVSRAYEKLIAERRMKNIISTCCPSVNLLVQRYYPELVPLLAPVVSPMIAHAKMLRETYGARIRVVFVGPCLAKKDECNDLQNEGVVDTVITFEELRGWLHETGLLDAAQYSPEEKAGARNTAARLYPVPGGVLHTLNARCRKLYRCVSIDGVDRCMETLEALKAGELEGYFLEMNTCRGGCVGGPCTGRDDMSFLRARQRLVEYLGRRIEGAEDYLTRDVKCDLHKFFFDRSHKEETPSASEIQEILNGTGKFTPDKELNCGACGYSTCREKAIAVFQGKAQLHMCVPYMRERAESLSNVILSTTPNGLIALDHNLVVQEINTAAVRLFGLADREVVGQSIFEFLTCEGLEGVQQGGPDVYNQKQHHPEYGLTLDQTIVAAPESNTIVLVLKDITGEEREQQQLAEARAQNVELAQQVIAKQMRVAQEIASLLGETTAETKVALTKLKRSIAMESQP